MTRPISIRLSDELVERLDRLAAASGTDRSEEIRRAIRAHLDGGFASDRPYDRVRDLVGSVYGGPPDLGIRHREYLKKWLFGERER